MMPVDKPGYPLEISPTSHSLPRNLLKMYGTCHPHPIIHQEKATRARQKLALFLFARKKLYEILGNEKSYRLASRVSNFLHPSRPCQTKKKKFLWRPEDKEIECSQAGAASWISLSFWIPKNSRSPIEMRLMTCLQEGSSKNNTYNKKSAGSQNLPRWFFWLSLLPPTKDP